MTLKQRIEAIYKLDAIRTQGVWEWFTHKGSKSILIFARTGGELETKKLIADVPKDSKSRSHRRDAELIKLIPEMVDIIRSLEAKVAELEKREANKYRNTLIEIRRLIKESNI